MVCGAYQTNLSRVLHIYGVSSSDVALSVLKKAMFDTWVLVQLACVLLGDNVPFRVNWPRHAELEINMSNYSPYNRSRRGKLGMYAVDEAFNLSPYVKEASNLVVCLIWVGRQHTGNAVLVCGLLHESSVVDATHLSCPQKRGL